MNVSRRASQQTKTAPSEDGAVGPKPLGLGVV